MGITAYWTASWFSTAGLGSRGDGSWQLALEAAGEGTLLRDELQPVAGFTSVSAYSGRRTAWWARYNTTEGREDSSASCWMYQLAQL